MDPEQPAWSHGGVIDDDLLTRWADALAVEGVSTEASEDLSRKLCLARIVNDALAEAPWSMFDAELEAGGPILHRRVEVSWKWPAEAGPINAAGQVVWTRDVGRFVETNLRVTLSQDDRVICIWDGHYLLPATQRRPPSSAKVNASTSPTLTLDWVDSGETYFPLDSGERYAALAGDRNPIHIDWEFAEACGFSKPIVHGMDTLVAACRLAVHTSEPAARVGAVFGTFSRPVPVGSTVQWRSARGQNFIRIRGSQDGRPCLRCGVDFMDP